MAKCLPYCALISPPSVKSIIPDVLNNRRKSSLFKFRRRSFTSRSHQHRNTLTRRIQHLAGAKSSSAPRPFASPAIPLPLPLPKAVKPLDDTITTGYSTHSGNEADATLASTPAPQVAWRKTGYDETIASRRSLGKPNAYMLNIPIIIPTNTFAQSPHTTTSDIFPTHYMSPPLDIRLSNHKRFDQFTSFSANNSPFHSPTLCFSHNAIISPRGPPLSPSHERVLTDTSMPRSGINGNNALNPAAPLSPLHTRLSSATLMALRESNAQSKVHPLPLPPTSCVLPPLPSPSPKIANKTQALDSQWKKGKLIGRGTFGSVYVGSNRETGALCAMKEVELLPDDPNSSQCIRQLEQEIKVLSQLNHTNIVQYYGSEIVGDRFFIYMEYVHPGSIAKYIHDHGGAMSESVVRNFTRHILSGLAYLHSTKTIHRDIKGANLLVDANGIVKLADFGMAKHITGQEANLSLKGSPYWMAPELLQSVPQRNANPDLPLAIDIWSLGCTIIEMMNGRPPWSEYEGPAAMFKVLTETPPIPETLSTEGKDFLHCCFQRNPAERPSARMLLEHPFVKS